LKTGFIASALLCCFGFVLGACIRSSTTLVPAHYHANLGAVTVAFMSAAYLLLHALEKPGAPKRDRWKVARWQLLLFGVGQTIFVLGFAVGGAYGLGRKAYAAEQHVRTAGEYVGLIVMGLGGLVAVAGGLWFLFLMLREVRGWRTASISR
jgi:heme/copper-type cytochrome/quinol oxidase subunit 1